MAPRGRANPLALAVLGCLHERPMHPYEMSQTMRTREKHASIKLNYGSLYGVVASLEKRGLVEALETIRQGRRPERTVYGITPAGRIEMVEWLAELISVPVKEYLQYEAGLALIAALPPDEVVPLLRQRVELLERRASHQRATLEAEEKRGLPRLFVVEAHYELALLEADVRFTRDLADEIESGQLPGLDQWESWYGRGAGPMPVTDGSAWRVPPALPPGGGAADASDPSGGADPSDPSGGADASDPSGGADPSDPSDPRRSP